MPGTPSPAPTPASAEEVLHHGLRLLLDKDITGWVGLWAEDGTMEFPFAPEGRPRRLEGREAIAAYMRDYPGHIDLREFTDVRVHRTEDPETVVAEARGLGRIVKTGRPFEMDYISVLTVRDGTMTACRDYWNPLGAQQPGTEFHGTAR
ncbi:nuclear transport factor 2 family protein [Streptomyces prasinus]|uniref:nuclear transport factor 2 family protein n=1 Tax=Streptomyces prasinus TaxID=67345 RepID=UPI0033A8EED5